MDWIQSALGWKLNTPNNGSNIGGVQPDSCGFWQGAPLKPSQAMLFVQGPAYGTVEAYYVAPVPVDNSFSLKFDLSVDAPSLAALMLVETDVKLSDGKVVSNFSLQRRLDEANMIQLSKQNGDWIDSGIIAPTLVPDVPMRHEIYYAQDLDAKSYGTQAVIMGGKLALVKPQLQGLKPDPLGWTPGAIIQIQITLGPSGGKAFILLDNMSL
jgi:hypothetical protein